MRSIIGLEIHARLAILTKLFCRCPVEFGVRPNTRVCPVCLGLPGEIAAAEHSQAVGDYKSGGRKSPQALVYLQGQVMQLSRGTAPLRLVREILEEELAE